MSKILTVGDVLADIQAKSRADHALGAYKVYEEICTSRGISLSPEAVIAAKQSFKAIIDISDRTLKGRYVLPLSAGSGKSTFMLAYCLYIHRFNLDYSVAIASFTVKECFNLRQQLREYGVPEEAIGVIHSYSAELENSCPSTSTPWKHRFLMVTHERLKDKNRRKDPLSFHGEERSIIFWDEEFRSREDFHFLIDNIRQEIASYMVIVDGLNIKTVSVADALRIKALFIDVGKQLNSHIESNGQPVELNLLSKQWSDEEKLSVLKATRELKRLDKIKSPSSVTFLERCLGDSHMFLQDGKVFGFVQVISDDIQQMLILDASYWLSKLSQMDEDVIPLPIEIPRTYENLTVTVMECGSGRDKTSKILKTPKEREDLMSTLAERLKALPQDEAALFFTFKDKDGDEFESVIRKELSKRGISMNEDERITVNGQSKEKYPVLTWGQQNGTNAYNYCRHMFTVGVHDLGTDNLIAKAVAQTKGRYLFDPEAISPQDINLSDYAQKIYQAIFRTAIRNHKGEPCTATLLLHKNVHGCIKILKDALDGARFLKGDPVFKGKENKTDRWIKVLIDILHDLPEDKYPNKISTFALFKLAEDKAQDTISPKTRERATVELRRMTDHMSLLWRHTGKSFERLFSIVS